MIQLSELHTGSICYQNFSFHPSGKGRSSKWSGLGFSVLRSYSGWTAIQVSCFLCKRSCLCPPSPVFWFQTHHRSCSCPVRASNSSFPEDRYHLQCQTHSNLTASYYTCKEGNKTQISIMHLNGGAKFQACICRNRQKTLVRKISLRIKHCLQMLHSLVFSS